MKFQDTATLAGTRKTADGYLVAEAYAVRTGIQLYTGAEVGLSDRAVVRVWRPEDEVRAPESLKTFSHAPITLGHPEQVTADNWSDLAKGEVSTEATWDGNKIKLPLIVKDAEAVNAVENGTQELSAGYTCTLEIADGVTPEGEAYNAIQRDIRINHLAIVPKGRAGSECRIGDGADHWGAAPLNQTSKKEPIMADQLKTVVLGDKAAQVALSDAQIVEQFKVDTAKKLSDMETAHTTALADKDKEIATKDAEIEKLKGSQMSDADLDARVEARAALVDTARKIHADVTTKGISDADIRKAVVIAKLGDAAVADKSDAYIEARFDVLAEDAGKVDPLTKALKDGLETKTTDHDSIYAERNKTLGDAWMSGKQEA